MSVAHILSFSRVVAGPIVTALILVHGSPSHQPDDAYLFAAALFTLASLTDLVDGKLARHAQQVSPLGVFLDTTADKVLVSLTLIGLALAGLTWAWVPLVIIGREFLISGLRSFAASCNTIISAHIWGKGKTLLTMLAIVALLLAADGRDGGALSRFASHGWWNNVFVAAGWLLGAAAILTIVSGIRYIIDAWPLFSETPDLEAGEERHVAAGGHG